MNDTRINLPNEVVEIFKVIKEYGADSYIVGGSVRDSILGRPVHDWDICSPVPALELKNFFEGRGYTVIPTGLQHGTITVMVNGEGFEITTYRKDGAYSDGRHPDSVEFTSDLEEDLSRRDFTINAMAYNPEGGLIDPFGGLKDIQDKTIRCVGYPMDRFSEDALRILRLWRFGIQLNFFPTDDTLNAAYLLKENLKNVSYERIQMEFIKALMGNKNIFVSQPNWVLETIIPEWKDMYFSQNNPYHIYDVSTHSLIAYNALKDSADLITRIATLLHDIGKPHCYQDGEDGIRHFKGHGKVGADITDSIMKRLKFDNNTRNNVIELIYYHDATFEVGEKYVKRWLNKIGEEQFRRLLEIRKADIKSQNRDYAKERLKKVYSIEKLLEQILKEKQCFSLKDLAINGEDIKKTMMLKEGKDVGYWLNEILNRVIDGKLNNNRDDLIHWMTGVADGWTKI